MTGTGAGRAADRVTDQDRQRGGSVPQGHRRDDGRATGAVTARGTFYADSGVHP
ncbi:hypothetical protein [Streptomyces sp. NPDC003710]